MGSVYILLHNEHLPRADHDLLQHVPPLRQGEGLGGQDPQLLLNPYRRVLCFPLHLQGCGALPLHLRRLPHILVPMYQDTSATAHLLALVLRGVAVHLVPRILWTVTPVYVGMMAILSVQAMTVAQLLPLPPQQPLLLLLPPPLPPQQPPQPPQPPPPPHHPPAPQCQALQQEQTASSPSPSRAPPTCPALSGSMEGRARAASGAPPRWTARGFMLMGRVTMASVELTVILTLCLWQRFLRVLLVQMLGQQVRRTRIL